MAKKHSKKNSKKSSHNTGKRGQRKHEKEQTRRNAIAARRSREQQRTAAPLQVGLESIADLYGWGLYEAAFRLDHPDPDQDMPMVLPQMWTPRRVAGLETTAIEAKLSQLGIRTAREDVLREARRLGSAVVLAENRWLPRLPARASAYDRAFVHLAACELWKRLRPEVASQEMLLELLLLGYESYDAEQHEVATEQWIRLWEALRPALGPEVRTTEAADDLLWSTDVPLHDWAMDLGSAGALAAEAEQDLAPRIVEVMGEVLAQFMDENEVWRFSLRADQAAALYVSGSVEEGERRLLALIAEQPRNTEGYVRLADLWAPPWCDDPEAIRRALGLLEQALAVPVDEAEEWELEEESEGLRARLAERSPGDSYGAQAW